MEKNKATRKYSGRKSSTPSRSQPNSGAALNSYTSGKGKALISIELSGTATLHKRRPKGNEFSIAYATEMRDRDHLPEKFHFQLCVQTSDEGSANVKLTLAECSDQVPQTGNAQLNIEVFEGATMNADESSILNDSDHHALHDDQKEKKAQVAKGAITGRQMSLDDNVVTDPTPMLRSACAPPAVDLGVIQEFPENNCELADDDPASRNLKRLAKRKDAESCEPAECVAADSQQNIELIKPSSKSAARSVPKVVNKNHKGHPSRAPIFDPENCNPSKSSSSRPRIPGRKRPLMSDLQLADNSYPKVEDIRKQDAPHDANHNASAKSPLPVPPSNVENQANPRIVRQNRKRKIPAEVTRKVSGKKVQKVADNVVAIRSTRSKDYFTGRLSTNGVNRTWSCSRPRMPRRRNTRIRFSLEPIKEDEREDEDISDDDATQVRLPDDCVVKSADYASHFGASHFHCNSNGQSRDIAFGTAQMSKAKTKAPSDMPSLRGRSTGLNQSILGHGSSHTRLQESGGCDANKHILDPNGEAHRIRTSTTPKQLTKEYAVPPKVQASQSMNMDMFTHGSSLKRAKISPTLPDHMLNGWPYIENKTPTKLNLQPPKPMVCVLNKNPADFSAPGPRNAYMINGEDLRFERAKSNHRGSINQRNLKHTSNKDDRAEK